MTGGRGTYLHSAHHEDNRRLITVVDFVRKHAHQHDNFFFLVCRHPAREVRFARYGMLCRMTACDIACSLLICMHLHLKAHAGSAECSFEAVKSVSGP